MTPLVWLGLAILLVGVAAFTGMTPRGGKPVARTHLMGAARFFLIGGILLCAALGLFGAFRS